MKNLDLSEKELKLLTEPEITSNGIKIFFPHSISEDKFPEYQTIWNKILAASEVDEKLIKRVKSLLPSQAVDIKKFEPLKSYNCFTAALYTLGVKGFDNIMELFLPDIGTLTLPINGISFFDKEGLTKVGFRQVPKIEEKGSRGLVLLENSMGRCNNYTAAYLGSSDGRDFYFHKPLPCLPDIKPLETILEACSYAGGRRKKAEVTYSFWQLGLPTEKVLVKSITPQIYNVQREIKEKKDPKAIMIGRFDLTPEILYHKGRAMAVITKCLFNGADLALSICAQAPDGRYGEWHEDPEHGDWPQAMEISRSRLEELAKYNPCCIPELEILGSTKKEVESILHGRKLFAYHKDAENGNFFKEPRRLLKDK